MLEILGSAAIALAISLSFYRKATGDLEKAIARLKADNRRTVSDLRAENRKAFEKTLEALHLTMKAIQSGGSYHWTLRWDEEKGEAVFDQTVKLQSVSHFQDQAISEVEKSEQSPADEMEEQ